MKKMLVFFNKLAFFFLFGSTFSSKSAYCKYARANNRYQTWPRLNEGIAGELDKEDDRDGDDYIEYEDKDIDKI